MTSILQLNDSSNSSNKATQQNVADATARWPLRRYAISNDFKDNYLNMSCERETPIGMPQRMRKHHKAATLYK